MRIEVYYEDRIDVFDTDRFTEGQPFGCKSVLANFELRYKAAELDGLWLHAHCYAAGASQGDLDEIPEGRRQKGWRLMLAGPKEASGIRSVVMDGAVIATRVGPDLADMAKLDHACELATGLGGPILGRICRAREYMVNADDALASSEARLAHALGLTEASLDYALTCEERQGSDEGGCQDWIGGMLDEGAGDDL